jgi:predicted metal-dependent peptidase
MSLQDLVDAIKNGDITFDEDGNPCDSDGNPIPVGPGGSGGEGHDGWDQLSDEDREFLKGKMKKILEDATQKADSSNGWGSVGAETRGAIREMISREVDWKKVLKSAVGNKKRAGRTSNVKRMNRKYPGVHPGTQRDYTSSWAIYVDQSGSVGDDELALAFGELNSLAKRTSFHVHYFDTDVDTENAFQWRKGQRIQAQRTRCGGTCFKAPTNHANKNTKIFDGSIIITDGYAPVPGPSRVRRVWVIVPGGELQFALPKGDVVVKMKWPNQKAA